MLKRILTKDVSELYHIQQITDKGTVILPTNEVEIYKVEAINIVACDENIKNNIYNSYLSTIRSLPNSFQIVVMKEKSSLKNEIEQYKKRMLIIENYGLKLAMKKYIEYLEQMENDNNIYNINHYLVVEVKNKEENDIVDVFSNLKELGIRTIKIKSKKDVESVLRRAML